VIYIYFLTSTTKTTSLKFNFVWLFMF
jgi:hypothetical protein